jgi:hypothetical protein
MSDLPARERRSRLSKAWFLISTAVFGLGSAPGTHEGGGEATQTSQAARRANPAEPMVDPQVKKGEGPAPSDPPDPQPEPGTTDGEASNQDGVQGVLKEGLSILGAGAKKAAEEPHSHPEAVEPPDRPESESSGSG